MAYVMAFKQGWKTDDLTFQGESTAYSHYILIDVNKSSCPVNNDIRGLIDSVIDGSTSAFMWEWFTTKPYADAGEVRFVRPVTACSSFQPLIFPQFYSFSA